jgi:hypothetical protein
LADHLAGAVDAEGKAVAAAEGAEVIGGRVDGTVRRRAEGVPQPAGSGRVADHLAGAVDAEGLAVGAAEGAEVEHRVQRPRPGLPRTHPE